MSVNTHRHAQTVKFGTRTDRAINSTVQYAPCPPKLPRVDCLAGSIPHESFSCGQRHGSRRPPKQARETRWLGPLSMDTALVVPAMTHCRTMCDHGFLSHWDIAGRKPYQRYSDFAYGQHVSEMVFGFDMDEATEDKVCQVKRAVEKLC